MNSVEEATREIAPPELSVKPFDERLRQGSLYPLTATGVDILQVNMGRLCNLSCRHCHVEAGPGRKEVMTAETVESCLGVVAREGVGTVDITGGAPEMNPSYGRLVTGSVEAGAKVMTRTNLVIFLEEGYRDLPAFLAENGVEVVASLPYFLGETTDRMRGAGAFEKSIEALKELNSLGYGKEGGDLRLSLVYNPCGAYLPPPQKSIEADFRRELSRRYGVSFTGLYALANMPVGRFLEFLKRSGNLKGYIERLTDSYNPAAAESAMCRTTVSVGWDGCLYDCDFNQMLGLRCGFGSPGRIEGFDSEDLGSRRIVTGPHCYGCAAGAGSSCTGEVA